MSAGHRTILPLQRQGEQLAGQVTRLTAGYRTLAAMWRAGPNAAAGPGRRGTVRGYDCPVDHFFPSAVLLGNHERPFPPLVVLTAPDDMYRFVQIRPVLCVEENRYPVVVLVAQNRAPPQPGRPTRQLAQYFFRMMAAIRYFPGSQPPRVGVSRVRMDSGDLPRAGQIAHVAGHDRQPMHQGRRGDHGVLQQGV